MNKEELEIKIADIRYFQKYELHDEALEIAHQIELTTLQNVDKITIYKLMCLSYRKLGLIEEALVAINHAIETVKEEKIVNCQELGICLMNKGVVYDSISDYVKACEMYRKAISIFRKMEEIDEGIMINALITYGEALCNENKQGKAMFYFREAMSLFKNQEDTRYYYILEKIKKIENEEC